MINRLDSLEEVDYMLFECLKDKHFFLQGWVTKPHNCSLEKLDSCDLWQVTIQSEESFNRNQNPEDVFLLQSVDYFIVG